MMNWKQVEVPYFFERMIGFSVPERGRILVAAYEALFIVDLQGVVAIAADEELAESGRLYEYYDAEHQTLSYQDLTYDMLGLHGGKPLLESPSGERLVLATDDLRLSILTPEGKVALQFSYEDLSGDWAFATFSKDGRCVALGIPYELFIFAQSWAVDGDPQF